MKKTICLFSAMYSPSVGGVERFTETLAKKLTENNYNVIVVTSTPGEGKEKAQDGCGLHVLRMPSRQVLGGRLAFLRKRSKQYKESIAWLQGESIDLIIINTRFYPLSLEGARFGKKNGIKTIILDHGSDYISLSNCFLDVFVRLWEKTITKKEMQYCSDFYGVSKKAADWLETFRIKAKGVIPNAVDFKEIENLRVKEIRDFRKELEIPGDAKVLAFVGRLIREKGIIELIEAMTSIQKERDDVFLIVAGAGPLEKAVCSAISKHILYTGELPIHDVIHLLDQADCFCFPSASEGFGGSLVEAAACRCFLISTRVGVAEDLIIDHEHGNLLNRLDVMEIEKSIKDVIDNDEQLIVGGQKVFARAKELFSWDTTMNCIKQLFLED